MGVLRIYVAYRWSRFTKYDISKDGAPASVWGLGLHAYKERERGGDVLWRNLIAFLIIIISFNNNNNNNDDTLHGS